jgi:hypothetical protein
VRSSTSSSNDRLPRGGWGRTWVLTLALALVPLAGLEAWWRVHGFSSEVQSLDDAWVVNLYRLPRVTTVALGTSRIRAALDPDAYRSAAGGLPAINLALPGGSPIPVLEYLADSTGYAGTVIVELLPLTAFDSAQAGAAQFEKLLRQYARERVSPGKLSEAWLEVHALQHLVFREPQLLPVRLVTTLRQGGAIQPTIDRMRPDGFAPRDQRRLRSTQAWDPVMGFAGHNYRWMEGVRPASEAQFARLSGRIDRASDRILRRGGTVVLLHMTACGERRDIEERLYPRARYWDVLARETHAIAIATEDFAELSHFDCFDGSHLDAADTPAFSKALGRLVRSRAGTPGPVPPGPIGP